MVNTRLVRAARDWFRLKAPLGTVGIFPMGVRMFIGWEPDGKTGARSYIAGYGRSLEWCMLADLVIIPIGSGTHTSASLAQVLKIIKDSGLPYQFTPASTCIEGTWEQIMALTKQCHEAVRADSPHLVTLLRLEEDAGQLNKLAENVASVEEEAGESFEKMPALATGAVA